MINIPLSQGEQRQRAILALDRGGMRGAFTLGFLGELESLIARETEVLDFIDERFGIGPGLTDEELPSTQLGVAYITKITAAEEPQLPRGATGPWPAQATPGGKNVKISMPDTGLQSTYTVHSWMTNVTGETEPPFVIVGGVERIRPYAGHGTFAAGVAACTAPMQPCMSIITSPSPKERKRTSSSGRSTS
jgi:hypothetical protein